MPPRRVLSVDLAREHQVSTGQATEQSAAAFLGEWGAIGRATVLGRSCFRSARPTQEKGTPTYRVLEVAAMAPGRTARYGGHPALQDLALMLGVVLDQVWQFFMLP